MVKPMKKFCSFALAVCVTVGSICVPAGAQTNAKAADANKAVNLLADAVYDEAVTFTESIAFLENGNWATSEWIDDKQMQYENVTKDTNIVLVDADGNKKVIPNSDGKGGKLFDAVYPMISAGIYQFDALKLIKNNKMAYLKADGSFIGGKEVYYNYAYPITEDILLVSDDKEVFRVINSKGEVTVDNIKNISDYILNVGRAYGDLRYIFCDDNCYVLDSQGNLVKEIGERLTVSSAGNGYAVIKKQSSENRWLIDRTGKVIKAFDGYVYADTDYIDEGYLIYYQNGKYILEDMKTNKIISKTDGSPSLNNDIIHVYDNGKESVYSLDGTVYIDDLEKLVSDLAAEGGYKEISSFVSFTDSSIILSMYDMVDTSKSVTYVLTEENGFKKDKNKTFEGGCSEYTMNSDYFITSDYDGYIKNMCTVDGDLIKKYTDKRYMYPSLIYENYGGNIQGKEDFVFSAYDTSVQVDKGGWTDFGIAYILATGNISKSYKYISSQGAFIRGSNVDGTIEVINSDNKVVYNGQGNASVSGYYYRECFSITENNRIKLYDRDGKVIFGEDKSYTGIANCGSVDYWRDCESEYYANDMDDFSVYSYYNSMLSNGMCVVSVDNNGAYNYGAIKVYDNIKISNAVVTLSNNKYTYDGKAKKPSIKSITVDGKALVQGKDYTVAYKNNVNAGKATVVITGMGDYSGVCNVSFDIVYGTGMYKGADGQWYYYKNGAVDKTYTGLAKNEYGWFYIKNGKLDNSYTGMAKNEYGWWYVKNGKLDKTYTGMAQNQYGWFYMKNGKLDNSYTGMAQNKYGWWYIKKGKLDKTYTGMAQNQYGWWYMKNGKLDKTYTGMAQNQYGWWYMKNGKLDKTYTGMAQNQYGWWYMKNGKLDKTYTGMAKNEYGWFYMKNGKLDQTFTGIAKNAYGTWYLQKGKLNTSFSGKVTVGGKTYTVKNGKVM